MREEILNHAGKGGGWNKAVFCITKWKTKRKRQTGSNSPLIELPWNQWWFRRIECVQSHLGLSDQCLSDSAESEKTCEGSIYGTEISTLLPTLKCFTRPRNYVPEQNSETYKEENNLHCECFDLSGLMSNQFALQGCLSSLLWPPLYLTKK